jgi:predicted amidophosphoribosyltransferase
MTGSGAGICVACTAGLGRLVPYRTEPTPAPPGLPVCVALGAYEGPLRSLILAYKDDGRHRLGRPLAVPLARGIAAAAVGAGRAGRPDRSPIVVVPVPSTAAAARVRHGDHMRRLARHAVRTLHAAGWPAAVGVPIAARPRADSVHLSAQARAEAARDAFRIRLDGARRVAGAVAAGACVITVDDVLTTGSTLAALTQRLAAVGVPVHAAVTLAATRRRGPVAHPQGTQAATS